MNPFGEQYKPKCLPSWRTLNPLALVLILYAAIGVICAVMYFGVEFLHSLPDSQCQYGRCCGDARMCFWRQL